MKTIYSFFEVSEQIREPSPDLSSAIRKIERYGKKDGNSYGKIDNLRMYYNGMQISKVKEDANPVTYTGAFDYTSDIIGEEPAYTQYEYYDDGSLKWDAAKGLSLISYNSYNTPNSVQFSNGNRTEYVYSSTGERLRTIYYTAVPNITVPIGSTISLNSSNTLSVDSINYYGEFIFENGQLSKYLFNGGYATIANGQPTYHYYEQDHLGNHRAVISHSGTVEQVTHYYPFGAVYGDAGSNDALQRYKYNGKELDRMHGLNFYDYGVRQYDPLLCRFTQVDPLAEKYFNISPYAYCANNPVNRVDPDGKDWYKDNDGTYQFHPNVHSQNDLSKGQTYLWSSKHYKNISYRDDGSILYNNETAAYNRMWNQADRHYRTNKEPRGREVGAFILKDSKVLVLPDYANESDESYTAKYGYKVDKEGVLHHGKESFYSVAQIHTHQRGAGDPNPSEADTSFSEIMGTRLVITMGHDGKVYGCLGNKDNKAIFTLPLPLGSCNYLLKGGKIRLSDYIINNNWNL